MVTDPWECSELHGDSASSAGMSQLSGPVHGTCSCPRVPSVAWGNPGPSVPGQDSGRGTHGRGDTWCQSPPAGTPQDSQVFGVAPSHQNSERFQRLHNALGAENLHFPPFPALPLPISAPSVPSHSPPPHGDLCPPWQGRGRPGPNPAAAPGAPRDAARDGPRMLPPRTSGSLQPQKPHPESPKTREGESSPGARSLPRAQALNEAAPER